VRGLPFAPGVSRTDTHARGIGGLLAGTGRESTKPDVQHIPIVGFASSRTVGIAGFTERGSGVAA
jgi:hypothetical protein